MILEGYRPDFTQNLQNNYFETSASQLWIQRRIGLICEF